MNNPETGTLEHIETPLWVDIWSVCGNLFEQAGLDLDDITELEEDELLGAIYTAGLDCGLEDSQIDDLLMQTALLEGTDYSLKPSSDGIL